VPVCWLTVHLTVVMFATSSFAVDIMTREAMNRGDPVTLTELDVNYASLTGSSYWKPEIESAGIAAGAQAYRRFESSIKRPVDVKNVSTLQAVQIERLLAEQATHLANVITVAGTGRVQYSKLDLTKGTGTNLSHLAVPGCWRNCFI
jgi:hypothetical protein